MTDEQLHELLAETRHELDKAYAHHRGMCSHLAKLFADKAPVEIIENTSAVATQFRQTIEYFQRLITTLEIEQIGGRDKMH